MKRWAVLLWMAALLAGACGSSPPDQRSFARPADATRRRGGGVPGSEAADLAELSRLETAWNKAHVEGDAETLDRLWADDLSVVVPSMGRMTKSQLMGFWRSGRSNISRYETSDVQTAVYGDAAVSTGRLLRVRDFNGQEVIDDWFFIKVSVRRPEGWRVVAWQASEAPKQ